MKIRQDFSVKFGGRYFYLSQQFTFLTDMYDSLLQLSNWDTDNDLVQVVICERLTVCFPDYKLTLILFPAHDVKLSVGIRIRCKDIFLQNATSDIFTEGDFPTKQYDITLFKIEFTSRYDLKSDLSKMFVS